MDAILAVSALHLRALNPNDQSYIRASHSYMASSIAQYSSLLQQGASESNAEALFATAALIAFQTCATRLFDMDGGYTLPIAWFHSFQGIKTVVLASWQWLRNSDSVFAIITGQPALHLDMDPHRKSFFAPLLEGMDIQLSTEVESTRAETQRLVFFCSKNAALWKENITWYSTTWSGNENLSQTTIWRLLLSVNRSYEHAVACLNWAHQKPDRGRILGFAATVSRRFVDLVGFHDPRSLVIVSCFFAMTRVVDDVWWLQGVAKREVSGIFNLIPQEWWDKMQWSLQIANHEGPFDENIWGVSWAVKEEHTREVINMHIDMLADLMNQAAPPMPLDWSSISLFLELKFRCRVWWV